MFGVEMLSSGGKHNFFIFENVSAQAAVVETVNYVNERFSVGAKYLVFDVVFLVCCIQAAEDGLGCQRALVLPCSELHSECLEQF